MSTPKKAKTTKSAGSAKPVKPTKAAKPAAATPAPRQTPKFAGRVQARKSGVHGKGVFALAPIAKGEDVIEYTGKVITWKQAQAQHPHNPDDPNHTFFFHIDEKRVIDGLYGNIARWINHSCAPNCEADEDEGRVFIKALRNIQPGEELNYDYGLILEERYTPKVKAQYPCWCGAKACRGTLLAPKR